MPLESELAQKAIQSNLVIQQTLTEHATKLQAQLKELEQLTDIVNKAVTTELIPEEAFESEVQIPGAKRVTSLIPSFELLLPTSPFYAKASQRAHYERWTTPHPINPEVLADAVRKENMRLEAYRALQNPSAPSIDLETNIEGIDWTIVAEKVTDNSQIKRTPEECRIQWIGTLRPTINKSDWTQEEVNRLHELIAVTMTSSEKINWVKVAKDLGTNRIPLECMKRATTRPRHHWDTISDEKLLEAVKKYGINNWNLVARHVSEFVTTSQCQMRYFRSIGPTIKRGPWSTEEDNRLRKAFEAYGTSWIDVSSVMYGRTNDQCRERWAEIGTGEGGKGAWSNEEDKRLLDAVEELGRNWKNVSLKVGGGRTSTNCRLRFSRIKSRKQKQPFSEGSETPEPMIILNTVASMSASVLPIQPVQKAPTIRRTRRSKRTVAEEENEVTIPNPNEEATTITEAELTPQQSKPRPKPKATRKVNKGKGKAVETLFEPSNLVDDNLGPPIDLSGLSMAQTSTSINSANVTSELYLDDCQYMLGSSQPRIPIPNMQHELSIGKRTRTDEDGGEGQEEEEEEERQRQIKRQKTNSNTPETQTSTLPFPSQDGDVNENTGENDENDNSHTVGSSRGPGRGRGRGRGRGGRGRYPTSTATSSTPRRSARVASTSTSTNPNPNP